MSFIDLFPAAGMIRQGNEDRAETEGSSMVGDGSMVDQPQYRTNGGTMCPKCGAGEGLSVGDACPLGCGQIEDHSNLPQGKGG